MPDTLARITAQLKNWYPWEVRPGIYVYWGEIYNDTMNRWTDGTVIHTSNVVSEETIEGRRLVHTLNSIYELIGEELKHDQS